MNSAVDHSKTIARNVITAAVVPGVNMAEVITGCLLALGVIAKRAGVSIETLKITLEEIYAVAGTDVKT